VLPTPGGAHDLSPTGGIREARPILRPGRHLDCPGLNQRPRRRFCFTISVASSLLCTRFELKIHFRFNYPTTQGGNSHVLGGAASSVRDRNRNRGGLCAGCHAECLMLRFAGTMPVLRGGESGLPPPAWWPASLRHSRKRQLLKMDERVVKARPLRTQLRNDPLNIHGSPSTYVRLPSFPRTEIR